MSLAMTKNRMRPYRVIAITLIVIFSLILIICLLFFLSIIVGMNKYGGEMADGFALITILPYLIYLIVFLIWTYRIYKLENKKANTYFQLGLIFLLGLILPYVLFARLDLIMSLIF
jgi:membrane protein YdbS with pleckstrin-like domain